MCGQQFRELGSITGFAPQFRGLVKHDKLAHHTTTLTHVFIDRHILSLLNVLEDFDNISARIRPVGYVRCRRAGRSVPEVRSPSTCQDLP